jgi:hypothetical protein
MYNIVTFKVSKNNDAVLLKAKIEKLINRKNLSFIPRHEKCYLSMM